MATHPESFHSTPGARFNRIDKRVRSREKTHKNRYYVNNFARAYRSWLVPYIKSRLQSESFRPVLSFLYTDLRCNVDCHYCYIQDKTILGMDMQVAKDAVDWLHSVGCRVLAYMGGEPLVRKSFIIELTRYAAEKGFFVYLPTNGILMDKEFIDEIGRAGVSTINLAVDAVEQHEGLPKYFNRIKSQFEYLVQQEHQYGYITFLNINITDNNIDEVRELTEIAHEYGIATDYHINEPPLIKYDSYEHEEDGGWISEKRFQQVDEIVDWLMDKNRDGYPMVNSLEHLRAMKSFIRHEQHPWPCRAGELSMIIRLDGSFAPCFELYNENEDWGNIYDGPKFDRIKLAARKRICSPHCLSTCNFQVTHYTSSGLHWLQWIAKHAYANMFGVS
ncbi:MAG: radical SAM protein [Deltaproteobacteria bacterium]|nr:radical SAM protein [Deltaproteobacteria bacterium]